MNAKQFAEIRKEAVARHGKEAAEGNVSKEFKKLLEPMARYAKMDASRIVNSIASDWIAANPDWKAAKAAPANDYAVFCDAERRTCIRVSVDRKYTRFIPMSTEYHVEKLTHAEFEKRFTIHMADYPVKKAAEMYKGATWLVASEEAKKHLEYLSGSKFKDTVQTLNFEEKEAIMATKPATKAPAKKSTKVAAPAKAAKVAAPKKDKAPKAAAGPDTRKITLAVEKGTNPKRGGAAERFALYKNNMTVEAYVEAGGKREDVAWDVKKGFITVQ